MWRMNESRDVPHTYRVSWYRWMDANPNATVGLATCGDLLSLHVGEPVVQEFVLIGADRSVRRLRGEQMAVAVGIVSGKYFSFI